MPQGWEQYLHGPNGFVNRGGIAGGGIYSKNNFQPWAEKRISGSSQNIQKIIKLFNDPSSGYVSGFDLNGMKFTLLRVDPMDGLLQGRSKEDSRPITVVLTNMTAVVGIGEPDAVGGSVSVTVSKVTDYLKSQGF